MFVGILLREKMCWIVVLVVCRLANWPSVGISCVVSPHICHALI